MKSILTPLLLTLSLITPAHAWHAEGHMAIARLAVESLPEDVPAFFRDNAQAIAEGSLDPDLFKNRQLPHLTPTEAPDHYFHLEELPSPELPETREDWIAFCNDNNIAIDDAGTLPYVVMEMTERLTLAFAEVRRRPDSEAVKQRAITYAGLLAHYSGDLSMPLHCTVHYNGRANPDGSSPRTGIHGRIDSLPGKVNPARFTAEPLPAPYVAQNLPLMMVREMRVSNSHVDLSYELDDRIPPIGVTQLDDEQVIDYTIDRVRHGAHATASLYLTAWRNSEDLRLPRWLNNALPPHDHQH
ncbi:MAG: hypothetical protein RIG82_02425 [Phycisphaeraceae bacterium]